MKISVITSDPKNPTLAAELMSGTESGVVIGADLARVRQLAFTLNADARKRHGWTSFSFAELAIRDASKVVGGKDYTALLSLQRELAASEFRAMGVAPKQIPKADELFKRRQNQPVAGLNPADPGTAVIAGVESRLQEAGYVFVDEAIRSLSDRGPGRLPIRLGPTLHSTHLVLLVTSDTNSVEATLVGKYLFNPDPMWISEITVVVENSMVWSQVKQSIDPGIQFEENILEAPRETRTRVNYGHLPWEAGTMLDHAKKLRTLSIARGHSIVAVTQNKADSCALRMQLLDLNVPVQCSESEFLVMRHGVFTLVSALSLARGTASLPALVRLVEKIPNVSAQEFDDLYEVLKTPGGTTSACLREMSNLIERLAELSRDRSDTPVQCLEKVKSSMATWANSRDVADVEVHWPALATWAAQFQRVNQMLDQFWRLRVLLSGWSGYRPGSGIEVTETLPPPSQNMIVLIRPSHAMPAPMDIAYQSNPMILAPLIETK